MHFDAEAGGTLAVTDSLLENNTAAAFGGGLRAVNVVPQARRCSFTVVPKSIHSLSHFLLSPFPLDSLRYNDFVSFQPLSLTPQSRLASSPL